jgi:NADH-quinone oxidoreductase subunit L
LAILSTLGGLVGIPYALSGGRVSNVFENTLEPVIVKVGKTAHVAPAMVATGHGSSASDTHTEAAPEPTAAEHATETHSAEDLGTERILAGLSVLLALSGIALGWLVFSPNPLKRMPRILAEKWRVDELYNGYIVDPITRLSREGLWKGFDLGFIDGIVNGIGHFVVELGGILRQIQVGFVRSYAAIILMGALVVIGYFIYYGFKLIA